MILYDIIFFIQLTLLSAPPGLRVFVPCLFALPRQHLIYTQYSLLPILHLFTTRPGL